MTKEELDREITLCAFKPSSELTSKEKTAWAMEQEYCSRSFLRFLRWVKIVEPPTQTNPGGVINFELWAHIQEFIRVLLSKRLIVLLKSRQIGASWTIAVYVLWHVLFHTGSTWMLFSKGEGEAMELLSKCYKAYNQLPQFLKFPLKPDSATEMGIPKMNSSIKALAATETAGISFTASGVVCDEHEEHPYADQNYLSAKPTIDAGGQFISIFTVNKLKPDTLAKSIYRGAYAKENGFTPLFFPYDVRAGRDRAWYDETKRNIPTRDLAKLTPDLYMEQNYPRSIEEALRATQTVSAFDLKVLDEMAEDTRNPVKIDDVSIDPLIVHIYQKFHIGEYYIASSDTSHGIGKDFNVTTVMNVKTGAVVADIMDNTISPEELALHSVKLLDLYKNPLWFIEDNDWGRVTITTAQTLGYKNFGYRDENKTKIGWHTEERSRFDLFGGLIPAINNRQITIFNSSGLKQFYDIIRNIDKNGRIEAMGARHDDYPVAVGIAWAKKDEVHTEAFTSKPLETLTFKDTDRAISGWITGDNPIVKRS